MVSNFSSDSDLYGGYVCVCAGCGTVYVGPNPKQPFSRAEDCEQFDYRDGDRFLRFSRAVFTVIDQIAQSLHKSNAVKTTLENPQMHNHGVGLIEPHQVYAQYKCTHARLYIR